MRKDGIPYVQNPRSFYPPIDYNKLNLEDLTNKFLKNCAKCNGDVSVCSRCKTPCDVGRRAAQLKANEIYNDPPVPLFADRSLIDKAREQNRLRKEGKLEEPKKGKDGRLYIEDWYEKAIESGDAVTWVVNNFHISKTKAKNKIYGWEVRHKEKEEPVEKVNEEIVETKVEKVKIETVEKTPEPPKEQPDSIESKTNALMNLQEQYKSEMKKYQKLYDEAKEKYDAISKKIDILCSAMDILNDN